MIRLPTVRTHHQKIRGTHLKLIHPIALLIEVESSNLGDGVSDLEEEGNRGTHRVSSDGSLLSDTASLKCCCSRFCRDRDEGSVESYRSVKSKVRQAAELTLAMLH
jgi:hypothetical protein